MSVSDIEIFLYGYRHLHFSCNDTYKDIAEDVETRFDTSNFGIDRPLPNGKNKK